ncbi:hypothetical protein BGZ58_003985 [Dissophora ornata]|nr:hypothetical protein BGZ58_003985 [Dissophora ornata]
MVSMICMGILSILIIITECSSIDITVLLLMKEVEGLVNHTDVAKKIPPPLHQTSSSSTLPRVAPSLSISDSNLSSAAVPGGDDEPVRSLLVKTPPRDV